jgi:hypothetical protein
MMSSTCTFSVWPIGRKSMRRPGLGLHLLVHCRSRGDFGMAAKVSGSVCAAQPVTMIGAPGFSRAQRGGSPGAPAHRLGGHRAGVDDHRVLAGPAVSAISRIASDS